MDLNADCLRLIIEEMDMAAMISLACLNENLLILIQDTMRRKLSNKKLVFLSPYNFNDPTYSETNIYEDENRIHIRDKQLILNILTKFGDLITKLSVLHESRIFNYMAQDMFGLINCYCSDNLREFHIYEEHDIFDAFKTPFKSVKRLELDGNFNRIDNSNHTFGELFPAMRELILNTVEIYNVSCLDDNYSKMEHLSTTLDEEVHNYYWCAGRPFNRSTFERFIENNLQIKSLRIDQCTPSLLRYVAEKLPQLQNLTLNRYKHVENDHLGANFQHVTKFEMRGSFYALPPFISFGDVEEFYTDGSTSDWMRFIDEKKNLKRLFINHLLSDSEIHYISTSNLSLVDVYFTCEEGVQVNNLIQLIENTKSLQNLAFVTPWTNVWQEAIDQLMNQFGNEWIITHIPLNIRLQRKW